MTSRDFSCLPVELRFQILEELLDSPETIAHLACTNRDWHSVIKSWTPWRALIKYHNYTPPNDADNVEEPAGAVESSQDLAIDRANRGNDDALSRASSGFIDEADIAPFFPTQPIDESQEDILDAFIETRTSMMSLNATETTHAEKAAVDAINDNQEFDRWRTVFVEQWQAEVQLSRGHHRIRGTDVNFGTMGAMQMHDGMIFGGFNNIVSCWTISEGRPLYRLTGHTSQIICLQVHDGYIVTSAYDKTVKIWNSQTGQELHSYNVATPIRALRFNRKEIICGDLSGKLYRMTMKAPFTSSEICGTRQHRDITQLQFDHRYICTASYDKMFQIYDRRVSRVIICEQVSAFVTCINMSLETVAIGTWSGELAVWKLSTKTAASDDDLPRPANLQIPFEHTGVTRAHTERINSIQQLLLRGDPSLSCLALSARDYPLLFSASNDGIVQIRMARPDPVTQQMKYALLLSINQEVPILSMQLIPKWSLDLIIISAASLDGSLHHWHLSLWGEPSLHERSASDMDVARMDASNFLTSDPSRIVSIGTQMTFASSFLPIMLYQDFIQLLMDRPNDPVGDTLEDNADEEEDDE